jgi:hypothetical protein
MFERLRRALVESFVGAIALGYLLAETIMHFVNIFAAPATGWVTRNELRGLVPYSPMSTGLSLGNALPEFIKFAGLLLIWYVLMRWLYFNPLKKDPPQPAPQRSDLDPNEISQ